MSSESNATVSPRLSEKERSRYLRANVLLGICIPIAIAVLAVKGYALVMGDTRRYLAEVQQRPILSLIYATQFNVWFFSLCYSYLLVFLLPTSHSRPPREPPAEVVNRTVIYECNPDGTPTRCDLGQCKGSYRPLRARHCRDCGTCKEGFDHHCPFMASCITTKETMKPFFCFLALVVPLIGFAVIPLAPLQIRAVRETVAATWGTTWMQEFWWNRWYSWAGGPVWRYAGALFIGYWSYPSIAPDRAPLLPVLTRYVTMEGITYAYDESPCPSLARPSLTPLLLVTSAVFVFWVAIAMIITIVLNCRRGVGTIQVERAKRWRAQAKRSRDTRIRVWVPLPLAESKEGGAVVPLDPELLLFDLGKEKNWRNMMGENWWHWLMPRHRPVCDDFEMNPSAVEQLRHEARKRM